METDTSVTPAAYRWKTEFVYDGLRRLRTRSEYGWVAPGWYPNSTTLYVYDGRRVVQERNSANGPTVSYVRGLDLSGTAEGAGGIGGLLARSSGYQTNGSWTSHAFYHADGGGNVTFLSPSTYSGTMTRYSYDAYGRTTSLNGPLATANVYRFSSKELHAASGHYYYGYRFYDPQAQRWINRDPLGEAGGMNLYGFVGNGPIHRVDPLGLYLFEWGDSWPNYLGPEPNAKPRVGPPPPPPAELEDDTNLRRCSYGGVQIGEDAAHEASGLVRDVGKEVLFGAADVAAGGMIGRLRCIQISRKCSPAAQGIGGIVKGEANCVQCALKFDARLKGVRNPRLTGVASEYATLPQVERLLGRRFTSASSTADIAAAMVGRGPGCQALVVGYRSDGVAHMFNGIVNQSGQVKFWNHQGGAFQMLEGFDAGFDFLITK